MPLILGKRVIQGTTAWFRPGTTDEKVLREVVDRRGYRKSSIGFDVEPGETWLDLGANIGAFAIYCKIRGVESCECYEPLPACFEVLQKNAAGFDLHNQAVTAEETSSLQLYCSREKTNHYRGSILSQKGMVPGPVVNNLWAGTLCNNYYDGIKMDIEGSEFGIIDNDLIPNCKKLCMEYHTSRDRSTENLKRRLDFLRSKFEFINYPPEYDKKIEAGGEVKTYFDRFIFCWNR